MSNSLYRIVIVGILAAGLIIAFRSCNKNADRANAYKGVVQLQHDTIVQFKDATGKQHARVYVQQADISVLDALYHAEIDSLKKLVNIKDKQIESAAFAGTQTSGSITPKVDTVFRDSSNSDYNLSYNDKWLTLDGTIGSKNIINYKYRDSLVFTTFKDKLGVRVDAFSLNPNTKLTGLTSLQLPPNKQKKFAIGPYIGITYSQGKVRPQLGIGLHYNFIRL